MKKKNQQLDPEMNEILDTMVYADVFYDAVLDQINLPKDDDIYRSLVLGILKRQTKDYIVFSVWNNLDEAQSEHLCDFIDQMAVIAPWMPHEDLLMEFAMMYPELMKKVHTGMTAFFDNFIARFNEMLEA